MILLLALRFTRTLIEIIVSTPLRKYGSAFFSCARRWARTHTGWAGVPAGQLTGAEAGPTHDVKGCQPSGLARCLLSREKQFTIENIKILTSASITLDHSAEDLLK